MKYATIAARLLLGLNFVVFGLNHVLEFIKLPTDGMPPDALAYIGLLVGSGIMNVVKVLEVAGGALLVVGKFVPLGLVILIPIIVNILLYEICLLHKPGIGVVMTALGLFLIYSYRSDFAPFFTKPLGVGAHGR